MGALDGFWAAIEAQVAELRTAKTADDVVRVLNSYGPPSAGDAFFAGSGGDEGVMDALLEAGWRTIWVDAYYFYAMRAPDGLSAITYVEGDVYRGDRRSAEWRDVRPRVAAPGD